MEDFTLERSATLPKNDRLLANANFSEVETTVGVYCEERLREATETEVMCDRLLIAHLNRFPARPGNVTD
jgi:hypothetical protein